MFSATTQRQVEGVLAELRALGSEVNRAGMGRYGINVTSAYGVSVATLRALAKRLGRDHQLALCLWATGQHEARLPACFVDEPAAVTEAQAEAWVGSVDSWDLCDQLTTSLLDRSPLGWSKVEQWAEPDEEWVKRAGSSASVAETPGYGRLASWRATRCVSCARLPFERASPRRAWRARGRRLGAERALLRRR